MFPLSPSSQPLPVGLMGLIGLLTLGLMACGDVDDGGTEPVATPECACDSLIDKTGQLGRDRNGNGLIDVGDTVQWSISVSYNGAESCSPEGQVCFEDTLPNGLGYESASGSDFTCTTDGAAPETVQCCSGSLPATKDFLGSVTLNTLVGSEAAAGELENCASLMVDSPKVLPNSESGNDTDCASVEVEVSPSVDLKLDKQPGSEFEVGEDGAWDFYVSNGGPDDATGVTLTDTLPTGMSFAGNVDPDWTCAGDEASPETVICVLSGTLAAGESADLSWSVSVTEKSEALVENCASLSSEQDEAAPKNNDSCATVEVELGCGEEVIIDLSSGVEDSDGSLTAVTGSDDTWMYLGADTTNQYDVPKSAVVHDRLGSYAVGMGTSQWVSAVAEWSSFYGIYFPGAYDYSLLTWEACFCVGDDADSIGLTMDIRADDEVTGLWLNGTSLHGSRVGALDGAANTPYLPVSVDQRFEVDGDTVVRGTNCVQVESYNDYTQFAIDVSGVAEVGCGCDGADLALGVVAASDTKAGKVSLVHKIENVGQIDEARYVVRSTPPTRLSLNVSSTESGSPDWDCSWEDASGTATCLWTGVHLPAGGSDASLEMIFQVEKSDVMSEAELCSTLQSRSPDVDATNDMDCVTVSF